MPIRNSLIPRQPVSASLQYTDPPRSNRIQATLKIGSGRDCVPFANGTENNIINDRRLFQGVDEKCTQKKLSGIQNEAKQPFLQIHWRIACQLQKKTKEC